MEQETASSSQPNHHRKKWLTALTLVFLVIGFCYLIYWVIFARFEEETDDAYVGGNLVQIMPQVSGRVISIYADETDLVKKGTPVVLLDKANAEIAFKNAESKLATTVREASKLYSTVDELRANMSVQKDNFQKAKEDFTRRKGLIVTKVISVEDLSHAKIAVDTAAASLASATNQLAAAIAIVQNSDLYHHPSVLQAADNLRNAYLNLQRTTIYAPVTGYIAKRGVELGQQVTDKDVLMVIIPLNQIWVNANFKESQLKYLRIGQPVKLIADAYGNDVKFKGKVVGLSPGTGSAFDLLPPQNATGNWIKIVQRLPVRIAIDPAQLAKYPLRIGLSMTVYVNTHQRQGEILASVPQNKIIYQTINYGDQLKKADELINQILLKNANNIRYTPQ